MNSSSFLMMAGLALLAVWQSPAVCLAQNAAPVDFAREVLPILSDNCYHCHGPDEKARKAKLRLDTKEGAFRVKNEVAVIVPGKPEASELITRILSKDPEEQMPPPDGVRKLTPKQIDTLERWVKQGAKWGVHWAFASPMRPAVPAVKDKSWPKNEIDAFVLARLEKEGISPQKQADRERLIRRVSLDLTGLPPTIAEIDAFLADQSADAYEKLVDRLLASPRYGERMAADWLDVARFADTHGYQADRFRPMTAYRDWVIEAFNQNMPFDQFTTWQLAGDLLPDGPTPAVTKKQKLATAFNRLHMQNEEGGIVEEEFRVAYVVDRVNTMGTAFLGMTFECSRCHDHKYDPISQKDFYSLFAMFQNIDESGQTTFFTNSMPVPTLLLSTEEQDTKLKALQANIDAAEHACEQLLNKSTSAFKAWNQERPEAVPAVLPGCVAHYSFDSMDKNQVANAIDAKSPGKATEGPRLVEGHQGKAIQLSGENGVTFPNVGGFSRSDPFSISLWIKADELAPRAVILHKSKAPIDAGSRGYELLLENGHVAFGMHHMWPGNSLKVATVPTIEKGKWTHITVVYDGSSEGGRMMICLDGVPVKLNYIRDGLWKDITYGGGEPELTLGHRFRDNGFRNGSVDELYIFNRELHPIEAAHLAGLSSFAEAWKQRNPGEFSAEKANLSQYYIDTAWPPMADARKALRDARKAQADFIEKIPEIMVMKEMAKPKPAYVLKRGNYDTPGEAVSADTPHAMPPFPADQPRNRLGLSRWLTDPQHPLTARVTVNRLWQQMFGRGLVETAENFGSTGSVPTNQELLDHLARVFVDDFKWDQKKLLKYIASSATYRQSSKANADLIAKDPQNDLLARGPARRLTAEMLRDQALAVSGLLTEKLGGPSVKPYQPAGLWDIATGKPNYDQSHGPDLYRRSLYTYVKRTVAPPTLLTFDAGDRSVCSVRRQSTSTPLQALTLLNDVQTSEAARKISERTLLEGGAADKDQVRFAFRLITGRQATDREARVLVEILQEQREAFKASSESVDKLLSVGESKVNPRLDRIEIAACTLLAQAILNHDEAVMRR